ncbi:hypothetical protein ABG088_13050 [Hydrogenibacillus schlegelii]|uniref:Uncharacterized protein n=1 Tax=Hydrogenibacillus schlegelii TaxID=1484 RepID=A0A179ISZ9_HYDSH|nr:hypothetical protein [Hydrogenibacillus schlegelii]OAR05455.1 hypothetical protein SA87_11220 [Hydrogenibacillus schlegelii]
MDRQVHLAFAGHFEKPGQPFAFFVESGALFGDDGDHFITPGPAVFLQALPLAFQVTRSGLFSRRYAGVEDRPAAGRQSFTEEAQNFAPGEAPLAGRRSDAADFARLFPNHVPWLKNSID